jgi:DNA-directed RNA polymerase specialized sigma subunit
MTDKNVKEFIKSYRELRAKKGVFDKIKSYTNNDELENEYILIEIRLQIIESALEILDENEREIVYAHLIQNKRWNEIIDESEYSERSFKRIQQNAISKMEQFIYDNNFERYIS